MAEGLHIDWTLPFILALAWLLLSLSLGAMLLLLALIRQHAVSRVASLLYLVPPATALEAYLLFGERLALRPLLSRPFPTPTDATGQAPALSPLRLPG